MKQQVCLPPTGMQGWKMRKKGYYMKECTIALLCNVTLSPTYRQGFWCQNTNCSTKTQPQTHMCLSMFFKEIRKFFLNSTGNSQDSKLQLLIKDKYVKGSTPHSARDTFLPAKWIGRWAGAEIWQCPDNLSTATSFHQWSSATIFRNHDYQAKLCPFVARKSLQHIPRSCGKQGYNEMAWHFGLDYPHNQFPARLSI